MVTSARDRRARARPGALSYDPAVHSVLLAVHSSLRWLVLVALVALFVRAVVGWRGEHERTKRDRILTAVTIGFVDLQLVLGLVLYFTGPWMQTLSEGMGRVMSTSPLRFFIVEHPFGMILALIVLHVFSVRSRKADDDKLAWRRLAIGLGVGLLLILISIPWPFMPAGRPWFRLG